MGIGQERKLMPHDALLRLRFPTGQGVASMTFFLPLLESQSSSITRDNGGRCASK